MEHILQRYYVQILKCNSNGQENVEMKNLSESNVIKEKYLLVMFSMPFYVDQNGIRYLDALWVKDLKEHAKYIPDLSIASPRRDQAPPIGFVALDTVSELSTVHYIDLPCSESRWQSILNLPRTVSQLWNAVSDTELVHSSIAAWPIAEAWIITPLLMIIRRFHIIVVESAPWRISVGQRPSLRARLKYFVYEQLGKLCLTRSNLAIFTQHQYRDSLMRNKQQAAYVVPASWIDESSIRSEAEIDADWAEKLPKKMLKLVFAGRLTQTKGLLLLIDAMKSLETAGRAVQLRIYGEGDLEEHCKQFATRQRSTVHVSMGGVLPYGQRFFDALRVADLVVIPSLSDEQPRIIFDAFSQGVPVVASRTPGLSECFEDRRQGFFFEPGSHEDLVKTLLFADDNRDCLSMMGKSASALAKASTHGKMHSARCVIINNALHGTLVAPTLL